MILYMAVKMRITLIGQDGEDVMYGDRNADHLYGEEDDDWLNGNHGNDRVRGGEGDDTLHGGQDNDTLIGDRGNDELWGDNGEDALIGVNPETNNPGEGEIDTLRGGEGSDTFALGDDFQSYYDDNTTNPGFSDYALILDFDAENDTIQLHGSRQDYRLGDQPDGLPFGASLYRINGEQEELIAMIQGTQFPSLEEDYFTFVIQ
jgi:Ca2+-binding RTX toxin-like protein